MKMLTFCLNHFDQVHKPVIWSHLFNIEIIDADGWTSRADFETPISFTEFLKRVSHATICQRK